MRFKHFTFVFAGEHPQKILSLDELCIIGQMPASRMEQPSDAVSVGLPIDIAVVTY
jgi:hypothetical protein